MLAIVIPYYKLAFFEKTLQSLSHQTNKQFKVYIGNDASPENPSILIQRYKSLIDIEYKQFEHNLGSVSLVKQWERCVSMANDEEWVMILCDDDVIDKNCVSEFYNQLVEINQLKINVIRYSTVVIDQFDEKVSKIHTHPKLEKSTDFLMSKIRGGTRSSLSEFVFRKSVLLEVKIKEFPLAWYSDVLAFLEVSKFNLIYTINESNVYFRLSGLNITSKNDDLKIKNVATFEFYLYLLKKKKKHFDLNEKAVLQYKLEKTFLDNKKNIYFWLKLTKFYGSNFYFKRYFLFLNKMLQSIYKKYSNLL